MHSPLANVNLSARAARAWPRHAMALGIVLAIILIEFHSAISAAVTVWEISPTYSHCFLILPIIGWLLWEKRDVLQRETPSVAPQFLPLLVPLLALWWVGELSAINEVRQYAVVAIVQVAILVLLGPRIVRQIWFPVLFLFALVPTGEYLIGPMQSFTARFVDISLNLLKVPHFTEGTVIELTNGRFEIAEACAGLRFLIATVTLGVLFAYLMYQRIIKVIAFLAASVIIPLIGNGLRCVGIILLAHFTDNKVGAGADHIVYGWGFNVAILLILIFVGSLFRDEQKTVSSGSSENKSSSDGAVSIVAVAAMTALLVSVAPAWAYWRDSTSVTIQSNAIGSALQLAGWRQMNENADWRPYFPAADLRIMEARDSTAPVELFVGYYARPRAGRTVTAHLNRAWDEKLWTASAGSQRIVKFGDVPATFNEFVIDSGLAKRIVWFTYWDDGTFTKSPMVVRLLQAKAALNGHEGQAVVALSTPLDVPIDDARSQLAAAVSSLAALPSALQNVSAGTADSQRAR